MAKFRVTTMRNEFTVECESFNQPDGGFGSVGKNPYVKFYNTKVIGEKEIEVIKAVVSSVQFVSAVVE